MDKLTFLGAGELAQALTKGFLNAGIAANTIWLTNRSNVARLAQLEQQYGVHGESDRHKAIEQADVVFLACRPADCKEALLAVQDAFTEHQLIISLMVGVPTDYISQIGGKRLHIVRAMPNTSAATGRSATGLAAGGHANEADLTKAVQLFNTVGSVSVVDESQIDAVAALAGSGPAYLYYLTDAMIKAGVQQGLTSDASISLVTQTIVGAAHMLAHAGKSAQSLLQAVATPGGTTEAGIQVLDAQHVSTAVADCIGRAVSRAGELSAPYSNTH
ncbi:MAG: pyrroline-5-carboxylate reductase [Sporolactobacillus sp.]